MTTKERPILFSGDEVRAILDGRKTQTRRPIKCCCNQMHLGRLLGTWGLSQPPFQWQGDVDDVNWQHFGRTPKVGDWIEHYQTDVDDCASQVVTCPFGVPGDLLWVKETHFLECDGVGVVYRASGEFLEGWTKRGLRWRPSIHMPRWASRVTLEVVSVRVERVQEITEDDAIAEGAQCAGVPASLTNRGAFAKLWNKINGPDSWNANPWAWVVEFRRVQP